MAMDFSGAFLRPQLDTELFSTSLASSGVTGLRANTSISDLPVFVDVGSRTIDSQVARDGVPIGSFHIDPQVIGDIILRPPLEVKVVSQSVAPGTPVPVGTTVNLDMAPPGRLPVGVVSGVHSQLADLHIADAFAQIVAGKPEINTIVAHAVANQLTTADTAAVRQIFASVTDSAGNQVEIDDQPGTDINAAIETLRVLKTFGA